MPVKRTYGCNLCGHTWQFLHMNRDEPPQRCPNGCNATPDEQLSAPSINRGEAKPGFTVPQSQAKREQLAADLALRNTGMSDINTGMKQGDIAAKPLPAPNLKDIPAEHQQAVREQITPGFRDFGQSTGGYKGVGVQDPFARRNLGILGGGNKLPPVQRVPGTTIHRPTRGKR